tara:strand:- start:10246 stop:10815 length:570 start_codon:yes stop_codon:yes gene_type:complete
MTNSIDGEESDGSDWSSTTNNSDPAAVSIAIATYEIQNSTDPVIFNEIKAPGIKTQDISCVIYQINNRTAINNIAKETKSLRTWSRAEGITTNPLIATDISCGGIFQNEEERMLNKKKYMFSNNRNNVESGRNGQLLTKSQIYSRVARGYTPQGNPSKKFGLQNIKTTNPNMFSLTKVKNRLTTNLCGS